MASARAAGPPAVELPVPESEHDHVREPDRGPGEEQLCGVLDPSRLDEVHDETYRGRGSGDAQECDQYEARDPERPGAPVDDPVVGHEDADEQESCECGYQPAGTVRDACGERGHQANRDEDRDRHRHSRLTSGHALPRGNDMTSERACRPETGLEQLARRQPGGKIAGKVLTTRGRCFPLGGPSPAGVGSPSAGRSRSVIAYLVNQTPADDQPVTRCARAPLIYAGGRAVVTTSTAATWRSTGCCRSRSSR